MSSLQIEGLRSCDAGDGLIREIRSSKTKTQGIQGEICSLRIPKIGLKTNTILVDSKEAQIVPARRLIGVEQVTPRGCAIRRHSRKNGRRATII